MDSDLGDNDQEGARNDYLLADFEAFTRWRLGVDFTTYIDILSTLGSRDIDRLYDWSTHIRRYSKISPEA